jgi:hypothetical protein
MMRLDHNRALSQVAQKLGKPVSSVRKIAVWGNHSATQYPDVFQAECDGKKVWPMINDQAWLEGTFIPTVQKRGAAIIEARGVSSAASAANAAIDHVRDWMLGSASGDWVSMAIPSDGTYGIPEGVLYGQPVTCAGGEYQVVKGIEISDFSRKRIDVHAEGIARGTRRRAAPPRLAPWRNTNPTSRNSSAISSSSTPRRSLPREKAGRSGGTSRATSAPRLHLPGTRRRRAATSTRSSRCPSPTTRRSRMTSESRQALEQRLAELSDEIRHYPTPIARCDEQLLDLLERRSQVLAELKPRRPPAWRLHRRGNLD